jgi:hypothetical protein
MTQVLSPAGIELLYKIKEVSDPQNVFGISNNVFANGHMVSSDVEGKRRVS